jgi:hypothetical protein
VSGFVCESFGYIPEEGGKMLVILERDKSEDNGEYQEEGSDHQDDRETTQAYELEVIVTKYLVHIFLGAKSCTSSLVPQ